MPLNEGLDLNCEEVIRSVTEFQKEKNNFIRVLNIRWKQYGDLFQPDNTKVELFRPLKVI